MKKVVKNIADGDLGIDQTVSEMWRLINRDVKNPLVARKAKELAGKNQSTTAKNIFNYVWKNHPYKSDPEDAEQLTAPVNMLNGEKIGEDCDGLVMLLVCLLLAAGIDSRIKVVAWRRHDYTHVVAEANINSNWATLDPTFKASGFGQTYKIIRQKIYGNPMGTLITLEDKPPCRCRGKQPTNQNIINIGNELTELLNSNNKADYRNSESNVGRRSRPERIREIVEKPVIQKVIEKDIIEQPKEVVKFLPTREFKPKDVTLYREWY